MLRSPQYYASRRGGFQKREYFLILIVLVVCLRCFILRPCGGPVALRFGSALSFQYVPDDTQTRSDAFGAQGPSLAIVGAPEKLSPSVFVIAHNTEYIKVHYMNEAEHYNLVKHLILTAASGPYWASSDHPPMFLDVGSNHGGFSLYATQVDPKLVALAVEPQSSLARLIVLASRINGVADRLRVLNCAVHEVSGMKVGMKDTIHDGGIGSITTDFASADPSNDFVSTLRIEELIAKEDRILIMKVDVESYEVIALRSARSMLSQVSNILVEWGPASRWINESRTTVEEGSSLLMSLMDDEGFSIKLLNSLCFYGFDSAIFPETWLESPVTMAPTMYRPVTKETFPRFVDQFVRTDKECYLWLHR